MSGGVIGMAGLSKTVVGFLTGIVGHAVHRGALGIAVRGVLPRDGGERRGVHGAVRAAGLAPLRHPATLRSRGRGSGTPSSASWRSRSSKCSRARSSDAGWRGSGCADEVSGMRDREFGPGISCEYFPDGISRGTAARRAPAERAPVPYDGTVLGAGGQLLGAAGRAARQVPGDGRQQPSADPAAARSARRALRPRRPGAGREPPFVQHLDRPRTDQGHQSHHYAARLGARPRGRRRCARSSNATGASPAYRPITIVQDASLAQVAAVTARRLATELPDVVVQQVPTRQYPETLAAHLFGYVGEVSDSQVGRCRRPQERRHHRPVGCREDLQRDADGRGRRQARRREQHRARSADARGGAADRGQAAAAHDRLRRAEGRSRTRSTRLAGSTARRSCSIRATATCSGSPAARRTTRTRSRPASTGRRGRP